MPRESVPARNLAATSPSTTPAGPTTGPHSAGSGRCLLAGRRWLTCSPTDQRPSSRSQKAGSMTVTRSARIASPLPAHHVREAEDLLSVVIDDVLPPVRCPIDGAPGVRDLGVRNVSIHSSSLNARATRRQQVTGTHAPGSLRSAGSAQSGRSPARTRSPAGC